MLAVVTILSPTRFGLVFEPNTYIAVKLSDYAVYCKIMKVLSLKFRYKVGAFQNLLFESFVVSPPTCLW